MLSLTEKEFKAYMTLEDAIPHAVRIVNEHTRRQAVLKSGVGVAALFADASADKKYVVRNKKQLDNMKHFVSLLDVANYTGLDGVQLKDTFQDKNEAMTVAFNEWIVTKRSA